LRDFFLNEATQNPVNFWDLNPVVFNIMFLVSSVFYVLLSRDFSSKEATLSTHVSYFTKKLIGTANNAGLVVWDRGVLFKASGLQHKRAPAQISTSLLNRTSPTTHVSNECNAMQAAVSLQRQIQVAFSQSHLAHYALSEKKKMNRYIYV
jgi:hypothetical protein